LQERRWTHSLTSCGVIRLRRLRAVSSAITPTRPPSAATLPLRGRDCNTLARPRQVAHHHGMSEHLEADYVIIGAGSAGCVLANRLSADGARVLLLEAGPRDWHPMIHVPAGVLNLLYNPRVNWMYATDPQPGVNGRRIHWPRGRVLGGSSSINGMLWIRGNPADYDGWSQMGCRGWS